MILRILLLNILCSLSFFGVLYTNFLANYIPINGKTTGELSALYPNYFVPAGITFSIWGIIYLLVTSFLVRLWVLYHNTNSRRIEKFVFWFLVSCFANIGWIYAWHHQYVLLSVGLMLVLFVSLLRLFLISRKDHWSIKVPFSVYFAWICVALIANITAYLVDINWDGAFLSGPIWAIIMMSSACIIALFIYHQFQDVYFQLVIIWAIFGIFLKQYTETASESQPIIYAAILIIILLGGNMLRHLMMKPSLKKG
jgi:benzodiazapine receptor